MVNLIQIFKSKYLLKELVYILSYFVMDTVRLALPSFYLFMHILFNLYIKYKNY